MLLSSQRECVKCGDFNEVFHDQSKFADDRRLRNSKDLSSQRIKQFTTASVEAIWFMQ